MTVAETGARQAAIDEYKEAMKRVLEAQNQQQNQWNNGYQINPQPCPSCGSCPTCGRGAVQHPNHYPYWTSGQMQSTGNMFVGGVYAQNGAGSDLSNLTKQQS